ncbi:MAG TPA: serine/threonine-protein kinase [Polyangiaceae bacterium]
MGETGRRAGAGAARQSAKYQAFAKLGEGGMAQVFLALARGPAGFNKLCVLKRMRSQYAKDESLVTMFIDEARLAARLNHPNVIHTYEVGENEGLYFIAMEYLEGQPLNRILAEVKQSGRTVPQEFWLRIVRDSLVGLQYAHDLKDYDGTPLRVVHRDVSPHNVFVTYDGQVKVVDFGIAKAAFSRTHTESGVLKGKVAYMSPEQARGEAIDGRSDLFAVGIVLWEALSGQNLYRHEYAATTLHKLLHETPPRLSTVVPDVDPSLDEIVAKALAPRPEDRYQSALQLRVALDAWVESHGEGVTGDQVGALVSDLFEPVREAVQRQIQAYVKGSDAIAAGKAEKEPEGAKRPSGSGPIRWRTRENMLPSIEDHPDGGSGTAVVGPSAEEERRAGTANGRRGSILWLLVATMAGALVAAVVVMAGVAHRSSPTAPSAAGTAGGSTRSGPNTLPSPTPPAPESSAPPFPNEPPLADSASAPAGATAHATGASTHAPRTASAQESAAPAAAETGYLSFDTYPWTRVSEGGRVLGDTPLVHLPLSPGEHALTLDNPEQGIHRTYPVTIRPGETLSRRLGLSEP